MVSLFDHVIESNYFFLVFQFINLFFSLELGLFIFLFSVWLIHEYFVHFSFQDYTYLFVIHWSKLKITDNSNLFFQVMRSFRLKVFLIFWYLRLNHLSDFEVVLFIAKFLSCSHLLILVISLTFQYHLMGVAVEKSLLSFKRKAFSDIPFLKENFIFLPVRKLFGICKQHFQCTNKCFLCPYRKNYTI